MLIAIAMFPSPMSALPIPTRLRVAKALLRSLLRRLGRVHLVRVEVEADAGRAARTRRSYTICTHTTSVSKGSCRGGLMCGVEGPTYPHPERPARRRWDWT
jgi:hypothetical protein